MAPQFISNKLMVIRQPYGQSNKYSVAKLYLLLFNLVGAFVTVPLCKGALQNRGAVRMTGGGFGGAIVCLCRADDIKLIKQAVEDNYTKSFNLVASIFVCKAGDGFSIM